jgi:hypothetical protein
MQHCSSKKQTMIALSAFPCPGQGHASTRQTLSLPAARQAITCLDRSLCAEVTVVRPDRFRDLDELTAAPLIAMGSASSYVAAGFGPLSTSVDMTAFSRILAFDPAAREIEVEASITLYDPAELPPRPSFFTSRSSSGLQYTVDPQCGQK